MTTKEFEVQRALGLAGEYIFVVHLEISLMSIRKFKKIIKNLTFNSKFIKKRVYRNPSYPRNTTIAVLMSEVKCTHKTIEYIKIFFNQPSSIITEIYKINTHKFVID